MNDIISLVITSLVTLVTSSGLTALITSRSVRQRAKADAMKAVQDVYQETINDLRQDRQPVMFWYWQGSLDFLKGRFRRIFQGEAKNGDVRKGRLFDALYSMDEALRRQEEMESHLKSISCLKNHPSLFFNLYFTLFLPY